MSLNYNPFYTTLSHSLKFRRQLNIDNVKLNVVVSLIKISFACVCVGVCRGQKNNYTCGCCEKHLKVRNFEIISLINNTLDLT
jgi:hypothetical protein